MKFIKRSLIWWARLPPLTWMVVTDSSGQRLSNPSWPTLLALPAVEAHPLPRARQAIVACSEDFGAESVFLAFERRTA